MALYLNNYLTILTKLYITIFNDPLLAASKETSIKNIKQVAI